MKRAAVPTPAVSPERQLAGFVAKFDAPHQRLIRAVRRALRKRLPTAHELVYDNYNATCGYPPRRSSCGPRSRP